MPFSRTTISAAEKSANGAPFASTAKNFARMSGNAALFTSYTVSDCAKTLGARIGAPHRTNPMVAQSSDNRIIRAVILGSIVILKAVFKSVCKEIFKEIFKSVFKVINPFGAWCSKDAKTRQAVVYSPPKTVAMRLCGQFRRRSAYNLCPVCCARRYSPQGAHPA